MSVGLGFRGRVKWQVCPGLIAKESSQLFGIVGLNTIEEVLTSAGS